MQVEMQNLKSIYHELQARDAAKSTVTNYPFINFEIVFECLIDELFHVSEPSLKLKLRRIAEQSAKNCKINREKRATTAEEYLVNRGLLLELQMRFAFEIFYSEVPVE